MKLLCTTQDIVPIHPVTVTDILGVILQHLPNKSDLLTLRLVSSTLARDVCAESHFLCFQLETMDQLSTLFRLAHLMRW